MKVLIGQPNNEKKVEQLENEIRTYPAADIILYPEGYLVDDGALETACSIAKKYSKIIITGYKRNGKNRAVIINEFGEKALDRAKTPVDEELYRPLVVDIKGQKVGYLLCREILKGLHGLKGIEENINFIAHPIGVGMFSEEQFKEWIGAAQSIAKAHNTMIFGTSHADGTLKGYDTSIPISYCFDSNGDVVFISKADTRTRIVDLYSKEVQICLCHI
jgi:hypothetical protein